MEQQSAEEQLIRVAPLSEPVRRALFLLVAGSAEDVTRDQAAAGLGINRSLAAFHLDKLVEAGLLEPGYRRVSGRTGPGAGRPSKVYRRAGPDLHLSIPPRDYELPARLLLEASSGRGARRPAALRRSARQTGIAMGEEARRQAGRHPGRDRLTRSLIQVLRQRGFEPHESPYGEIRLRNCPFDALAVDHTDTVCGMNLSLLEGVVAGLGVRGFKAVPDRQPGWCCVVFRPTRSLSSFGRA